MKKDKVPKVKGTTLKMAPENSAGVIKPLKRGQNACKGFNDNRKLPNTASAMIIDSSQDSFKNQKSKATPDGSVRKSSQLEHPSSKISNQNQTMAFGKRVASEVRDSNKSVNLDKNNQQNYMKNAENAKLKNKEILGESELGLKQLPSRASNQTSYNQVSNQQNQNCGNQNINPNIMLSNQQKGQNAERKASGGQVSTKKRNFDQMNHSYCTNLNNLSSPNSQRGPSKNELNLENQLIGIYRQNYCSCSLAVCKESLTNKLKQLFKQNETFSQIQSLLFGCPKTDKRINILVMILKKIHFEDFGHKEMDALLDLFIVVYYKCNQEVQLTLLDDIDKCMSLISEANQFKGLRRDSRFTFTLFFFELFKFQNCMKIDQKNQENDQLASDQQRAPCSVMNLAKIKERCKRYDPNTTRKSKIKTDVQIKCEQHGDFDQQSATFQCKSATKFISFTCFLIQFKFKLLNIEDISQTEKDRQRREMTNIIKCMIQECDPSLYYYPMRALQEFYCQEVEEKSLGKRLKSESFLQYKLKKERQGRSQLLMDFKKLSMISKQSSHSYQHHQYQVYLLIYHDTIELIRQVIGECNYNCNIVCLKILQKLTKIQQAASQAGYVFNSGEFCSRQQLINFKVDCLQAMVQRGSLSQLCDREKQIFYEEVKLLIAEVQSGWSQREAITVRRRQDRKSSKINQNGQQALEDSDSDLIDSNKRQHSASQSRTTQSNQNYTRAAQIKAYSRDSSHMQFSFTNQSRQFNPNTYQSSLTRINTNHSGSNRSKSITNFRHHDNLREEQFKHDSQIYGINNMDLSILEPLLTIETVTQFPKLSLLVFQAMRPMMPIFVNNYIQILNICEKQQLLKFEHLQKETKQQHFEQQISDSKLKKFNCSGRRESLITTWMSGQRYRSDLEKGVNKLIQMHNNQISSVNGQAITSIQRGQILQLDEHQAEVKRLCRLRRLFTSSEIVFVFDFLLVICKHAIYRRDAIAVSIATHLIQDFQYKSHSIFNSTILDNQSISSELLALNFEIRSKKFIEEQTMHNKLIIDDENPKDELFTELFDKVFKLIKNPHLQPMVADCFELNGEGGMQAGMSSYTSTFFKQIIRIFQTSRKFLNIDYVKPLIDQLITGNTIANQQNDHQLLVIVNSLPLYLAIQMFFDPNQIGVPTGLSKDMVESNDGGLSYKLWQVIKSQIDTIKNRVESNQPISNPMLVMQRIYNLIHSSTSMLQYFLCFQTPLVEKSSSSQIHSCNSQNQLNLSPIQIKNSQNQSQKTIAGLNSFPNQGTQQISGVVAQPSASSNAIDISMLSSQLQQQMQINHQRKSMQSNQVATEPNPINGSQMHNGNDGPSSGVQPSETFENTFVIKRQKYCNFCSSQAHQAHPNGFTFSRKCASCSMKNSCLLMPARFLCNMCIDHNHNDLYRCDREEIPLEGVRDAPVLHSTTQVRVIQKVIKEALAIWQQDIDNQNEAESFWQSTQVGCVDKCCEMKYMYSNILTILTSRMLKLMLWVLKHRLQPEPDLLSQFKQIEQMEFKLTAGFQQITNRIQLIKQELSKIELEESTKGMLV